MIRAGLLHFARRPAPTLRLPIGDGQETVGELELWAASGPEYLR
jgi:hypothetical protein